jgi:integrase
MTGWSPLMRGFREAHPKLPAFTLHDLRRTVRTGYDRLGIARHVAELALNHALSDDLARVYDRGEYWPERVRAADAWCAHVARVVG